MRDNESLIDVKILDRVYKIKCPKDEAKQLQDAAEYLNSNMKKLKSAGNTSPDRLAVIAALNISNEYLLLKKQKTSYIDIMSDRITALHDRIKHALAEKEKATTIE